MARTARPEPVGGSPGSDRLEDIGNKDQEKKSAGQGEAEDSSTSPR